MDLELSISYFYQLNSRGINNSFFQEKILDAASSGNLFNNNIFKNYFRGFLFEVEEIVPNQGAMAILDFSKAELKIIYKSSIFNF